MQSNGSELTLQTQRQLGIENEIKIEEGTTAQQGKKRTSTIVFAFIGGETGDDLDATRVHKTLLILFRNASRKLSPLQQQQQRQRTKIKKIKS